MTTKHIIILGDSTDMHEIPDDYVHLVITSPPYYNAPFDYKDFYSSYDAYLAILEKVAKELFRVLQFGRIIVLNIDDMLVNGVKYPIVADATKIFQKMGFNYRDRIIWKKPDDYFRILRRRKVLIENPFPMYFYPDNILESILIFQKGKFDYKSIPYQIRESSKIDVQDFQNKKMYSTLWEIRNVMPNSILEKGISAFPDEIPKRFIQFFSYTGEYVLDPFAGSGTTMKLARMLNRNSIGIELNQNILPIIVKKVGFDNPSSNPNLDIIKVINRYELKKAIPSQ
jgi:site-specific DNA-methyltransferase (adenine-specific)